MYSIAQRTCMLAPQGYNEMACGVTLTSQPVVHLRKVKHVHEISDAATTS